MSDGKWLLSPSRKRLRDGTLIENKVVLHYCSHPGCERWGSYLIGAKWLSDIRGTPYCREHLPVNEALALGLHTAPGSIPETADENRPDAVGDLPPGRDLDP